MSTCSSNTNLQKKAAVTTASHGHFSERELSSREAPLRALAADTVFGTGHVDCSLTPAHALEEPCPVLKAQRQPAAWCSLSHSPLPPFHGGLLDSNVGVWWSGVSATIHSGEQALLTPSKASHPVDSLYDNAFRKRCRFSAAGGREAAGAGRGGVPAAPGGGQGPPGGTVVRGLPLLRAQGDLPAAELGAVRAARLRTPAPWRPILRRTQASFDSALIFRVAFHSLVLRCEASEGTAVPQREQSVSVVQFLTVKTDTLLHFTEGSVYKTVNILNFPSLCQTFKLFFKMYRFGEKVVLAHLLFAVRGKKT